MIKVAQILKDAGIVVTRQRMALLELILNRKDHPDAEGVYFKARESVPTISIDTVYRTLNLFAESGVVQRMAVPTRRARFDGNVLPHDHYLCVECECIIDIPSCSACVCAPDEAKMLGSVQEIQTVYVGKCHSCAQLM